MSEISVSVVIPAFNVEDYVARAVESVVAQSYPVAEIVCVNDGSTDKTLDVLYTLQAKYSGQVTVLTGPNRGACHARNRGTDAATGDYIQYLDADDVLQPDKIALQVALVEAHDKPVDLLCAGYERLLPEGASSVVQCGEHDDDWVNLVDSNCGITSSNLWRRSAVLNAGGWNDNLKSSQEVELMFRMLERGANVVYDNTVRTQLHAREGSISFAFDETLRIRHLEVRGRIVEYLRDAELLTGKRKVLIYESIFKRLRGLYKVDADAARALYRKILPRFYVPPVSEFNTFLYVVIMRLVGFDGAEKVRRLAR